MLSISEDVDVLVVGGGTAGVIAALQAARAGVRTALVERTGQLGGTITTGGVFAPQYFYARDRQVIAGIGWELVTKTKAEEGLPLPDFAKPNAERPSYAVAVNPGLYAVVAEEMALAAGVALHYHEIAVAAAEAGAGFQVTCVGKGLRREVRCRELVDCTGDADLVGMLGFGRETSETRQPGTLEFKFTGYDAAKLEAGAVQQAYERAMSQGRLRLGDWWRSDQPFIRFLAHGGYNALHVPGADSTTSATQTQANIAGRTALMRLFRFVRTLPGCEEVRLAFACGETAVRETWRIVGETKITYADYMTGRRYPDAVGHSFYFIDVHTDHGVEHEFLAECVVPAIPLAALTPRGSRRLLVAGRSISSDRKAHSALRVQASCMAMGQGAGAAAALGVKLGVPSREVPVAQLQGFLRQHGAIVP